MSTPNIGANTPESAPQGPHKVGAIPGLTKKIMTALAAIGLATSAEKVEGASVILGTGLSHSSVSATPSKIQGAATSANVSSSIYNSRLRDSSPRVNDISIDRIYVTLSPDDIKIGGGQITITGIMSASTSADSTLTGSGKGFSVGEQFRVQQEARFGLAGGSMTTIEVLDSGMRINGGQDAAFTGQDWWGSKGVNYTMNITQPGTYHFDNVLIRQNATGNAQFEGFTLNYTAVPEPSTGALVGGVLAAGLLRRRRDKETNKTQE